MAIDSTHPSEAGGSREQLVRELAELRRQLADEKHFSQRMLLEATRKSDQMYRALAANLPGGAVFILDRHLRYQLAEGQALQTAGFASAAFEGRTIWEALDASTAAEYEPRFRRVLEGGTFKYEHNSHGRHFVSHGVPIHDAQGAVTHVLAVSYDITDRKLAEETLRESEERFRAVFESSSDCILVWDRQYNYMYANQAAIDHVGTTRDRVIGRNIRDGLGHIPDFMRLWMERVDRAFATGEPFRVEDAEQSRIRRFLDGTPSADAVCPVGIHVDRR